MNTRTHEHVIIKYSLFAYKIIWDKLYIRYKYDWIFCGLTYCAWFAGQTCAQASFCTSQTCAQAFSVLVRHVLRLARVGNRACELEFSVESARAQLHSTNAALAFIMTLKRDINSRWQWLQIAATSGSYGSPDSNYWLTTTSVQVCDTYYGNIGVNMWGRKSSS